MTPTIEIKKENDTIKVSFPKDLRDPSVSSFFTVILGFEEISEGKFNLDISEMNDTKQNKLVLELLQYLINTNLKFNINKEFEKILKRANKQQIKTKETKERAQEILKKKKIPKGILHSSKFIRKLKPFQEDSVNHIVQLQSAANFSVPGSGKTTIVYAAYSLLKEQHQVNKMLIIGPNAAYLAWEEEYEKCLGIKPKIIRVRGPKHKRNRTYHKQELYEIFFLTYQTLANDVPQIIEMLEKDLFLVVLDESHYIKRIMGGVWAPAALRIAPYAQRRIILTGTPLPNSLLDIWTQVTFLDPTESILGSRARFKMELRRFGCEEKIRELLSPFYRRIKKNDLDLPQPNFKKIFVKAKPLQREIYNLIARGILSEPNIGLRERRYLREIRRALIIRLMQAASNPGLICKRSDEMDISSLGRERCIQKIDNLIKEKIRNYSKKEVPPKIEAAERLARTLISKGRKVLIWSTWIHNIEILEKRLKEFNPVTIYGDIPTSEGKVESDTRELRIRNFKKKEKIFIMIANPGACGESISLHDVCHDAIYVDRTFNGAQYMQSLDRIHRIGLKPSDKITYYLLLTEDTIDETIHKRLNEKISRMLELLKDDFKPVDLESSLEDVSDLDKDEKEDFNITIQDLKRTKL